MSDGMITTHISIDRIELPTPFLVGTVNVYVLQSDDQVFLIDSGPNYEPAKRKLLHQLTSLQLRPEDVTGVILTHGHVDHVGLAGLFQAAGAKIYTFHDVSTWLEPGGYWDHYRADFFGAFYGQMGVPDDLASQAVAEFFLLQKWNDRSVVDEVLQEGQMFSQLPGVEVRSVPGHAQSALALWLPASGEMFIGDQLLPHISSNALIEPVLTATVGAAAQRTLSLLDYRRNLQQLRTMPIRKIHPGHGQPFFDVHRLLDKRLGQQLDRRDRFLRLLTSTPQTAYDVAIQYFPSKQDQLSLILSETVGYLDWLRSDGLAVTEPDAHGVIGWRKG